MGRKLALIDEDTGEVLQIIATADEMARRAVHKSVMNHISNTLGALSDDKIEGYVREAVAQSVSAYKIQAAVDKYVRLWLEENYTKSQLRNIAAEMIAKRLQISIKQES